MKALWVYTKAFTPEECKWIVETVKKEKPSWARTGGTPTLEQTFNHRRSKVFWINQEHPKLGYLLTKVWNVITPINNQFFGAHLMELPPLQFTQYSEKYQGEYKIHQDLNWLDIDDEHTNVYRKGFQRKVSCVIQLSDPKDYDGGEFEFGGEVNDKPPQHVIKEQGTLFTFPSFIHHGVRPVTRGTRYSLVGWFEGPPWR